MSFEVWIEAMLQSLHREGYQAPNIRRVYIPKPGKQEKRPLGVPCVADRALQRSAAQVLSAIYEQDFLSCSFGGRPGRGAHQALATLHEVICSIVMQHVGDCKTEASRKPVPLDLLASSSVAPARTTNQRNAIRVLFVLILMQTGISITHYC